MKTTANDQFPTLLPPLVGPNTALLTLQNGLGNIEILSEYVGRDRAMQGVTMQGATLLGPGRIRTSGRGAHTLSLLCQWDLEARRRQKALPFQPMPAPNRLRGFDWLMGR